ncbi:amino acid/polyamine transporter I [Talaromyces proteolyticus]|uniref:Amino acid/polyamine transporter I n=1 Tax=Talaromyces proteolyticus TaxID=1131652 RepID=A0AAD4KKG2_9EURO|nr:amino acid/polyamine transporter I [Talaromyces proteolyticus]KAH8693058.1 amino acid/polyamine transporter I [Talaromyces proteolyticus]
MANSKKSILESKSLQNVDSTIGVANFEELHQRPFNLWSTLGLAFSVTCTPLAIGSYLSVSVGVGGSPVFLFGYIFSALMNLCICISLAEISAIYPHASGQIYWTAVLSPKRFVRPMGYLSGWLTSAGWLFWGASSCLLTSQLTWALVQACDSTFVTQLWHFYVLFIACAVVALIINIPLFRWYPHLLKTMVFYTNLGAIFIFIVLLVRATPKQSAEAVFVDIINNTGWDSKGVVFFIGLLPGVTAVNAFDSAAHLAEEMPEPRKQVPKVMMISALLSFVATIPMIFAYMFSIVNQEALYNPVGNQPIIQLFLDSMASLPLTIISSLLLILAMIMSAVTILTTFSRIWWSLARDNGTPFPHLFSRIMTKDELPVPAILFGFSASVALGAIQLGSTTAINAILGAGIICMMLSYVVPIILFLGARNNLPDNRYFNLGRFGAIFNVIAILWTIFIIVWLFFPLYLPVTALTMNYSIAVIAGVFTVSLINWFAYSRKVFKEPTGMVLETVEPIDDV